MTCYVCLEECDEKSPCECGQLVHEECLMKVQKNNCTICKKPVDIEILESGEDGEYEECEGINNTSAIIIMLMISFVFYIISGYVGKCVVIMFRPVDNFAYFWTPIHLACSFIVTIVITFLSKIFY